MNFFKKFRKILSSPLPKTERAMYLYVQCDRCGEKLRARVDIWNELTPEYGQASDKATGYFCRKVLIGQKLCYQPIELKLKFDQSHQLISQEIDGGKFIDKDTFDNQN